MMALISRKLSGSLAIWLCLGLFLLYDHISLAAEDYEQPFAMPIQSRMISSFLPSEPERKVFGKLQFLGGLELFSDNEHFGGYSGFRFIENGTGFLAISDLGFWLSGELERSNGAPSSVRNAVSAPMRNPDGSLLIGKWSADAEGLEVLGDKVAVTFERKHRMEIHGLDLERFEGAVSPVKVDFQALGLRGNKGLEAVVKVPDESAIAADFLLFSERSLDNQGNIRAFLLEGNSVSEFSVTRLHDFDITAAAFSPDGRLLLLERRFNIASGVALRIRSFDIGSIAAGATVDGEVLMVADNSHQIDNFEGLDVSVDEDGSIRLTLISDDNHYILQRTLLLEFKLLN